MIFILLPSVLIDRICVRPVSLSFPFAKFGNVPAVKILTSFLLISFSALFFVCKVSVCSAMATLYPFSNSLLMLESNVHSGIPMLIESPTQLNFKS